MGLGVDGNTPRRSLQCPYHIGIVAAESFLEFEHEPNQAYVDSFDKRERARDNIHWVVAQGDLISPDGGIQERIRLVRKTNPRGNKNGTVTIVTSRYQDVRYKPSKLANMRKSGRSINGDGPAWSRSAGACRKD